MLPGLDAYPLRRDFARLLKRAIGVFGFNFISSPSAAAGRAALGSGAVGDAVFQAATAAAARSAIGAPAQEARVDVASAATLDITGGAPSSDDIRITGTTTITAVNLVAGRTVRAVFAGALTLTNGAGLTTNTGANIITQAGDSCLIRATALNTVEIIGFAKAFATSTTGGSGKSMVRLHTSSGYGATNTAIRRFTTAVTNQGIDVAYADSGANGASFTIIVDGVYAISYSENFNASSVFGLSLNGTTLTSATGISGSAASERLAIAATPGASLDATVSWTGYLAAGSVVRPHTDGGATGAATRAQFTITRVA